MTGTAFPPRKKRHFPLRPNFISAAIVLFWLCMMCSLVAQRILTGRREAKSTLIQPDVLALQWVDITEWNLIKKDGRTVGASFLNIAQERTASDQELGTAKFHVFQSMDVTVPVFGFSQSARMQAAVTLTPSFNVDDFSARIEVPPFAFRIEGFVEGRHLYFRLLQGGEPVLYQVLPLKNTPNLLSAIEPMMARHTDLKVGESYAVDVVDPLGFVGNQRALVKIAKSENIRFGGVETPVFRIDTTVGDSTKSRWVDIKGRTLRAELVNGLAAEAVSRHDALISYPRLDPDLEENLTVPKLDRKEFIAKATEPSPELRQRSEALGDLIGQMMRGK
jgi:hypothetical protein